MPAFDLDAWVARSRAIDLAEIDWAAVPHHAVSPETIRTLRYMQDIEIHTIIYTRALLATRAIDDPDVSTFRACWTPPAIRWASARGRAAASRSRSGCRRA